MRTTFVNELIKLAEKDERIVLLTADMGFSMFEKFKEKFPERYYNMGIAEQNMIGAAAGLAMRKKKPYVYSIIPFLIMRSYEQIRVDICYHELDVKFIGSGGGVSYGQLGATHHAIEDINLMRGLPNIQIIAPGDPFEAKNAITQSYLNNKPTYIRLSKNNDPLLHLNLENKEFKIGKSICMKESNNLAIITTSNMLKQALEISNELDLLSIKNSLYSFHTIKPIDSKTLKLIFEKYRYLVTMEEHNIIGGLYGAIMEEYGKGEIKNYSIEKIIPFAINDKFSHHVGDQNNLREYFEIDKQTIINKIKKIL